MRKRELTVNSVFYVEYSCNREFFPEKDFSTAPYSVRLLRGYDCDVPLASSLAIIRANELSKQAMTGKVLAFDHPPSTFRTHQCVRAWAALAYFLVLLTPIVWGQDVPINPPPGFGQIPQGAGACSVEKSCADLAPLMIQSALGPSPLEDNLRKLGHLTSVQATGLAASGRTVAWAVAALRLAGADQVHPERFAVDTGGGRAESENVVGEIRGRDKPDEFVVLGAQLDSRGSGPGALTSGSDVAMVIDAARVIHASGNIPRRSIRFVLFAGDKPQQPGSQAYARAHRAELDRMIAGVFVDSGAGHVTGYSLGGRNDLLAGVGQALEPLRSIGPMRYTLDARADTDNLDFELEGVPTLVTNRDVANDMSSDRTSPESFDKLNFAELKRSVAIAAVTAYALADAAARIGHRQTRAEVEQLLKDSGLEQILKTDGGWTAWEDGGRGREP